VEIHRTEELIVYKQKKLALRVNDL
jgi:hypothetical protein